MFEKLKDLLEGFKPEKRYDCLKCDTLIKSRTRPTECPNCGATAKSIAIRRKVHPIQKIR
ncbi:MAG: hypothetical protein WCI36_00755 [bacterium]